MSTVISIENLWKEYRLGVIGHGTLTKDLQSWWARVRGKEDPNSQIAPMMAGQEKQIDGDRFWALQDVNLEVKEGEILGVIGKNGAGKSTLLKILSRVTAPTKGNIKVKGRIASLLEVGTGFHPELTGRENIFMNGAILGMSKWEIRGKLDEIIDFSGVENFIDTPVKRYSSGMYVRLAFAVAAHLESEILIIDEVLAVGDADFQKKCLGKMENIASHGRTVLFVSHNLNAVKRLCPSAVLLENGRVQMQGFSEQIMNRYLETRIHGKVSSRQYDRDENKEVVQIRSIKVTDGESVVRVVDLKDEVEICIEYEFYKDVSNVSVGLQITDNSVDEIILNLSDPELDLSRFELRKKGYYQAKVKIPANLLNTAIFFVKVGISHLDRTVYDLVDDVSFEVEDKVGILSFYGLQRKPGILSTQLPWNVEKIS
ncbi:ABC transporter ATP-binding protein [Desulfobulbus sp. US5]|nr:ABC transporter ATP-binding protein [Desulfobulbus sp. US5]